MCSCFSFSPRFLHVNKQRLERVDRKTNGTDLNCPLFSVKSLIKFANVQDRQNQQNVMIHIAYCPVWNALIFALIPLKARLHKMKAFLNGNHKALWMQLHHRIEKIINQKSNEWWRRFIEAIARKVNIWLILELKASGSCFILCLICFVILG